MKWESLNLHIENLIPGVITLVLLLALVPKSMFEPGRISAASILLANAFVTGGVFIAASYSVGIFAAAICRCIIDPISSLWPRPRLFRLFYPQRFKSCSNSEINRQYREAVFAAVDSESEYKRTEIKNRRERGRLLRSGILPLVLFVWLVTGNFSVWVRLCLELLMLYSPERKTLRDMYLISI